MPYCRTILPRDVLCYEFRHAGDIPPKIRGRSLRLRRGRRWCSGCEKRKPYTNHSCNYFPITTKY